MDKKVFLFDTNFIIQNKALNEVYDSLKDRFDVYVTQVSIDERIAQQCREYKKKYDKINSLKQEYSLIADITVKREYCDVALQWGKWIQKSYSDLFGSNIIPYNKDGKTFSKLLDRANDKLPPFIEKGSDKGFKDALIWLSILEFFKKSGGSDIVFVTEDNGFLENSEFLVNEFLEVTGKKIEFKKNSYYKELILPPPTPKEQTSTNLPDFNELRNAINEVIGSLCYTRDWDEWGNPTWYKTFVLSQYVDSNYMESIFTHLREDINNHIFDKAIYACDILALDERMTNTNFKILIENFEKALQIYERIEKNHPEYLPQFYTAAANIFNDNYINHEQNNYDEPPF